MEENEKGTLKNVKVVKGLIPWENHTERMYLRLKREQESRNSGF